MLRTDLNGIINSGKAWAFIGSGISADAGAPTWKNLIENILKQLEFDVKENILIDKVFEKAFNQKNFSKALSRVENFIGREKLEEYIKRELQPITEPGKLAMRLADWPFSNYITTNYDGLLEIALQNRGALGWLSIGNSDDEIRKVSGSVNNIIWHIHGSINLNSDKSKLIITEEDFDSFYLPSYTFIKEQLKHILSQQRIVFIGFSFQDEEVKRVLKEIGSLANPAYPIFAFLSDISGTEHESEREEYLKKYNIDIIPYRVIDGSHEDLWNLTGAYESMILKRSLRFGESARECPAYDAQATGLLIYNELCLHSRTKITDIAFKVLLRSRVLSILKQRNTCTIPELIDDLAERIRMISGQTPLASNLSQMETSIAELYKDNLINIDPEKTISLAEKGKELVESQSARAVLLADQFAKSLQARAELINPDDKESAFRVAFAAESFLKQCIQKRALGVALVLGQPRLDFREYNMVALLQSLPEFMPQLSSRNEAVDLINLIQEVLARPTEIEKKYIGLVLQAQFGIHLLGYDPDTLKKRLEDFSDTLFLIDSSSLIPFKARSSNGHKAARFLLNRLKEYGTVIATTDLLIHELAEHANWAIEKVQQSTGNIAIKTLEALLGEAGNRSNAFLEGFIAEIEKGLIVPDFFFYLNEICGCPAMDQRYCKIEMIENSLEKEGIICIHFDQIADEEFFYTRDELQKKIADLRKQYKTYRHERQVKAEAEAILITRIGRNKISIAGKKFSNAFFISHTRILDEVEGGTRVTMRPEAILQLTTTMAPFNMEEIGALTDSLLWELEQWNCSIIDRSRLEIVFSPVIDARKAKLEEYLERHRLLLAQRYGENSIRAFKEIDSLEIPTLEDSIYAQMAKSLESELKTEKKYRLKLQEVVKLTEEEKNEFERLKAKEKARKQKNLSKKRAALSKKGKKRKKK